jgi:inhibitor of cysteine peptidase
MWRIILVCAMVGAISTACGDGDSRIIAVGEVDAGTTVTLVVGDTLEVTLPSNPSTGHTWQVAGEPRCVVPRGEARYTALDDLVGSGGLLTWDLEAVEAGAEELSLVYRRPWENVAPDRTFTVRVVVEG